MCEAWNRAMRMKMVGNPIKIAVKLSEYRAIALACESINRARQFVVYVIHR